MTYDEYIKKEGVALPIAGFEDLVFDYLEALNEQGGWSIPIDYIIEAIFVSQELVPIIEEVNEQALVESNFMQSIERGGDNVH